MGMKELFVVMGRGEGEGRGREGEGGDGNYCLSSLPCLGREREMKEKKQSIYINRSSTAFQRGGQWKRV